VVEKKIYKKQEAEKELRILIDYLTKAKPIKNLLKV
jgi:hypothetical protein